MQYHNMWLSLIGCTLCVGVMFLMSWITAFVTLFILFGLYLMVQYRKPGKRKNVLLAQYQPH